MSIQEFAEHNKEPEICFESLYYSVLNLQQETNKFPAAIRDLEVKNDFQEFKSLYCSYKECDKDRMQFYESFCELEKKDPNHPKAQHISQMLKDIKIHMENMRPQLIEIEKRFVQAHKVEEQKIVYEANQQKLEQEKIDKTASQMKEEQQEDNEEHTSTQMKEINEQAKILQDANHNVDNELTKQHDIPVKVNNTVSDAKSTVEQGNVINKSAEKIQTSHFSFLHKLFHHKKK